MKRKRLDWWFRSGRCQRLVSGASCVRLINCLGGNTLIKERRIVTELQLGTCNLVFFVWLSLVPQLTTLTAFVVFSDGQENAEPHPKLIIQPERSGRYKKLFTFLFVQTCLILQHDLSWLCCYRYAEAPPALWSSSVSVAAECKCTW